MRSLDSSRPDDFSRVNDLDCSDAIEKEVSTNGSDVTADTVSSNSSKFASAFHGGISFLGVMLMAYGILESIFCSLSRGISMIASGGLLLIIVSIAVVSASKNKEGEITDFARWFTKTAVVPLSTLALLLVLISIPFKFVTVIAILSLCLCAAFVDSFRSRSPMKLMKSIPTSWSTARPLLPEIARSSLSNLRPFFLASLYLAAAPITVLWILSHWLLSIFRVKAEPASVAGDDSLVIAQNVSQRRSEQSSAFYNSKVFSIVTILVVALGLPTVTTLALYEYTGMKELAVCSKVGPIIPFNERNIGISPEQRRRFASMGLIPTTVAGQAAFSQPSLSYSRPRWNSKKKLEKAKWLFSDFNLPEYISTRSTSEILMIKFGLFAYVMSLAWCFSILFIRAYFLFPYSFSNSEFSIILSSTGVRKTPVKGWLTELLWYCYPSMIPRNLSWDEVVGVDTSEGGIGRLHPLPVAIYSEDSLIYKGLNKFAALIDAFIDRLGRTEYLDFRTSKEEPDSSRLSLLLNDVGAEDRARLFYAIRRYRPDLHLSSRVQKLLLGTTVDKEPRYTEIWFDLLLNQKSRMRTEALKPDDELLEGRFIIVDTLGSGGQAVAYLAKDSHQDGKLVVLKEFVISQEETMGALLESTKDFENECNVLRRLDHDGIVKMIDMFAEDQRAYIVLDYVEGLSLRELVRQNGPLTELEVINLGLSMCELLTYLHEQESPVVHRDFTPENIIWSDGRLTLIDFSVAGRSQEYGSGDCVGKHSYTPPEQFRSESEPRSDIYALGATLHFLLTGSDPKPISVADPRSINQTVSAELAGVIKKATALELEDRYESAVWMAIELDALRNSPSSSDVLSDEPADELQDGVIDVSPQKDEVLERR